MRRLITGNRGFIGSGLTGDGIDLKDGVDIRTYKGGRNYDVVVHTAALVSVTASMDNPEEYFSTNIEGTLNMVRQHPEAHFVYLSTAGVYGEGVDHTVKSPTLPTSIYAWTKLMGEVIIQAYAKSYSILRLTNVIGPGERGEPNVYHIFEKSDIIPVYGDGLQTRDFVSVDRVREVIELFCHQPFGFKRKDIVNVGSGVRKTVLDVAREFNKPIKFLPERPGEIKHFGVADAFHYSSKS